MKIYDVLDLTAPDVVLGNHGCWLPRRGIKVPFQFGGEIRKRSRPAEPGYPLDSIVDEYNIMRALVADNMSPPVGDLIFFREVISTFPGAYHSDPCGAYGYEVADAGQLQPGRFSITAMRTLPIEGSEGAWGDVLKPDNIVNGYLVDVRRSGFDMLKWRGQNETLPTLYDGPELCARIQRECQFPKGERTEAYQDFWLAGNLVRGQRRVVERAALMGFYPKAGDSVLDIGTQSGSFLQYAWNSGARKLAGVEVDPDYVDCAKALARSCKQNICFRIMDVVKQRAAFLEWVRAYFPDGVSHCLTLSMEKHLGEDFMFALIDEIGAKYTYVETNAVGKEDGPMKLWPEIAKRGGKHVSDSTDRNLRRLYRIDR